LASSPTCRASASFTSTASVVTSQRAAISVASSSFRSATLRRFGTFRSPSTSGRSVSSGARRLRRLWFWASSSATNCSAVMIRSLPAGARRAPAAGLAASEPTDESGSRPPVGRCRGEAALAPPDVDSIGLFTGAEPVLVPLGDVGERREVAHPVQVHHAVQVVALVLDDAREEVLGDQAHGPRVTVVALEADRAVARHDPTQVG